MADGRLVALRARIQKEFQELPGLRLTRWQAARLWALDIHECDAVLKGLVAMRVLRETRDGFIVSDTSPMTGLVRVGEAASIPGHFSQ